MVLAVDETFRVRHEAEDATGFVLESGDGFGAAVEVFSVEEGGATLVHIFGGFGTSGDKAPLGVGDGQLELIGQSIEVGTRAVFFEMHPAADETSRHVVNEAAGREEVQLRQDLEAIADLSVGS